MIKKDESLFSLANIQRQYVECRRHKRNTANALRFEAAQEMNLLTLREGRNRCTQRRMTTVIKLRKVQP